MCLSVPGGSSQPWFHAMFAALTALDHQISDTRRENSSISSSDLTIDDWPGRMVMMLTMKHLVI